MDAAELLAVYAKGIRNFKGADLEGVDLRGADLRSAYLRGADLRGADLRGADLRGADLRGADLRGADLEGADLQGANLGDQWIIQGPARSDGYFFFFQRLTADEEPMVKAGCRYFTVAEAHEHWGASDYHGGKSLAAETSAIVECMAKLAEIRGYK